MTATTTTNIKPEGLTDEILEAYMINPGLQRILKRVPLYRADDLEDRYYYSYHPNKKKCDVFLSVTSFTKNILPTSKHLLKWIKENGSEADAIKEEKAIYGTFLHIQIAEFLKHGKYDFSKLRERLRIYLRENVVSIEKLYEWKCKIESDMLAFAQFCMEMNLTPIAIEIPVSSKKIGLAGTIDLIAEIDLKIKGYHGEVYKTGPKKGQPKETYKIFRVVVMIDFKSGRKGFYESHELQLHIYKKIWNEIFQNVLPIEKVFNWSPKNWRGNTPTYNFKDQTNSVKRHSLNNYLLIAKKEGMLSQNRKINIVDGELEIGKDPSKHIKNMEIRKFLHLKQQTKTA